MSNPSSAIKAIASATGVAVSIVGIPVEAAAVSTVIISTGCAVAIGLIGYGLFSLITSDNEK
jgi:hypothetical protein